MRVGADMPKPKEHVELDIFVRALKVFADTPWLHYGLWLEGQTPSVPGLRMAQERYVDKLLALLPVVPSTILDIGGGTGALSARLASLGHAVEMLTPSEVQFGIAREVLVDRATVHLARFEDFVSANRFDVCLFSESFQYIPLAACLAKLNELLAPGGRVVIADCFRSAAYRKGRAIGGGHRYAAFIEAVGQAGFTITSNEDVTALAAPSIAIDRMMYRDVLAPTVDQLDRLLRERRPVLHWLVRSGYRLFVRESERRRIADRLKAEYRTPELFLFNNTYRFLTLERAG